MIETDLRRNYMNRVNCSSCEEISSITTLKHLKGAESGLLTRLTTRPMLLHAYVSVEVHAQSRYLDISTLLALHINSIGL